MSKHVNPQQIKFLCQGIRSQNLLTPHLHKLQPECPHPDCLRVLFSALVAAEALEDRASCGSRPAGRVDQTCTLQNIKEVAKLNQEVFLTMCCFLYVFKNSLQQRLEPTHATFLKERFVHCADRDGQVIG